MKQQNRFTSIARSSSAAVLSALAAFIGWGYLSGVAGVAPGSTPSALPPTNRETVLNDAKKAKKHEEKSSNVIMNDPFMALKWGLEKTNAPKAWEITKGSKDIVIAVIDTGIDENHKDIASNLWENQGEIGIVDSDFCKKQKKPLALAECDKSRNGVDDDNNGFKDDVHGWNFVHNDNKLNDNHGHGQHIAGIIAANGAHDGHSGVSGVAPNVSIMALKYYDPKSSNSNNLKNTVNAIRYAIKMKANIINYSGGGTDYSAEEFAAVKEAEKAGILFIAAAGNERSNSDEAGKHYYPADYGLSNIISVTAVNKEKTEVLASSNFGVRTVDLAAPGENIYSTLPNNAYGTMTGTSQATAFVTGVAALVMSHNRDFAAADVKRYILRTGDEYPTLLSKTGTAKLLNSFKALSSLDLGVGLTGVVASNTAKMENSAFASNQNLKNPRINTVSALNETGDPNGAPAEEIALFGRDFMKALQNKGAFEVQEIRHR